ncbi:alpha/beta hydrolase [Streptacidiphilus sp. PB12-B1b]|uniref:alpha/beta hydrolase n=1 Tax=Streptacidiphilus sp. PB12-B1b TaxID=2705012 RepID=UPI0015FC8FBA|nr:alpha/beta hydrolase [Streptacidiphilus sp. PB12-B1b]QMU74910.1 alpha/beta hydrolase [Streptacidiphilus sp. PB12-B1b]
MSREILTRTAPPPDLTTAYGPLPEQVVDLRLPDAPARTLVVLVHGGFWRAAYDRTHTGPLADALARAGFAVAVPEYRRMDSPGGGWPGTFDDVAAFTDALDPQAPDGICARHGLRPERTVLVGHSAGGHLALWAAGRHRLPEGSPWRTGRRPDRVVPLAGCVSLALCDALGLDDGAAAGLLGGGAAELPDRYALADPAALLPLGVPVTLLHGVEDVTVPPEVSRDYAARAGRAGDPVELVELPALEHFALIDPDSAAWPTLLAAINN